MLGFPLRKLRSGNRLREGAWPNGRRRHAAWFLALAEEAGPLIMGRDQVGWLDRMWRKQYNFRAAMRFILDRKDADREISLTWAFWRYWWVTGLQSEARRWMEEVLEGGDVPGDDVYLTRKAQANLIIGTYAWSEGDLASALPALEEGLRLSQKTRDARAQAIGLMFLGLVDVAERHASARGSTLRRACASSASRAKVKSGGKLTPSPISAWPPC